MSKTLQRNLKKKIPNVTEWDSSDDDDDSPEMLSKQQVKVKSSKSSKGKKNVKYDKSIRDDEGDSDEEKGLVLYIGHLPKDFEESDLRRFLSQFGKVYNCRVARKIETGRPKGYAFVRFGDEETSKIVCETLHGYFLDKQRLVCQLRPSHPGMFFDTDKIIETRNKKQKLEAKQRSRNLTDAEKLKKITSRLVAEERKKRERLQALGIDYDFPGYKANRADFEAEFVPTGEKSDENQKEIPKEDGGKTSEKKKRRKESIDSTRSEGSATKKKKKKRKDSIDSSASSNSMKQEASNTPTKKAKKKEKKRRNSSS